MAQKHTMNFLTFFFSYSKQTVSVVNIASFKSIRLKKRQEKPLNEMDKAYGIRTTRHHVQRIYLYDNDKKKMKWQHAMH